VENELQLDEFIEELNSVQPSVRYGQNSIAVSSGLPAILIILGAILRKQIVGDEKYLENYGLAPSLFMPRPGTNEIQQDLKIYKILHLYFEHNITFSGLSIPDTLDFMGIKVDTIDLKNNEVFKTCPWCNGYTLTGQAATFKLRIFLEDKEK
jgi:hypothetical protein